jgi:uncharacterized protein (DUF1697 family)
MALVVLLKGINVGGHRRVKPSLLAKQLKRYDVVNIGAAGTFVVLGHVSPKKIRSELARRLPFEAEIMICGGIEVRRLISRAPFAGQRSSPTIIQFVSRLAKRPRARPRLPLSIPSAGGWCVRVQGTEGRFVFGVHRREMKAITHLGGIDTAFGSPATTRSWSTILAVGRVLETAP